MALLYVTHHRRSRVVRSPFCRCRYLPPVILRTPGTRHLPAIASCLSHAGVLRGALLMLAPPFNSLVRSETQR